MVTTEELYKFEQELVAELGFVVPSNNVVLSDPTTTPGEVWNFDPPTNEITASQPRNATPEEERAIIEFSMAHEICHMIQSFVMKNNLDRESIQKLSVDEYNELLNKFFGCKTIELGEDELNKFKVFAKDCPFLEKEALKALKFDDFYYVSGNPNAFYDKVYHNNSTEIYANYFASAYLYKKYEKEGNKSVEFMRGFAKKIQERTCYIANDRSKIDKEYFEEQMRRSKPRWQRNLIKIANIFGYMKDLSPIYNNHDFANKLATLNNVVKLMESVKVDIEQKYKTPAEIEKEKKEIEKCIERLENASVYSKKPLTIIDDFIPGEQNNGRYGAHPQKNLDTLANLAIAESNSYFATEVVVDVKNKTFFTFREPRLEDEPMKEADKLLDSENIRETLDKISSVMTIGLQVQEAR